MALYIKDSEVDALAGELAAAKKVTKTEAVREALKHELERQRGKLSTVDIAVRFSRELRARGKPKRGRKADKRFFDELSGSE
jgi:antitoxin VapB